MAKIIECIPNFSEGRNMEIVDALVAEAKGVPGVLLLDHSSDPSHNRSVFTLVGDPDGIAEAAFRLCKLAGERIDMTAHSGEHPRMGATDVIPFVPIQDVAVDECVEISKRVAERIWNELAIPSFLYEHSAAAPARQNLAKVRKGQFEGMPEKLLEPEWAPDFGERKIHPTAGITAIGARPPLVAYNVNLNTSDVRIAQAIADRVRGIKGGYTYCKAMGVLLEDRNIAQVSMNLVNYEKTPIYRVQEAIRFEAKRWGVEIIGSELIGLAPAKALIDCAEYYLQIENFDYDRQVLENHLL
ncbi:glutamate formimidoyltransferase [Oscillospiraceae bacterium OttesenSCG-928-F05]|nr:glutamate formimidoyltransferase [Oscillospiraceae bacterium OttesenSCG-928-F05]